MSNVDKKTKMLKIVLYKNKISNIYGYSLLSYTKKTKFILPKTDFE